jgi:UDP-N-acetylmuramate: L-alanyl-gamma-D-glutamyl-meso-diaminopimelate ligase
MELRGREREISVYDDFAHHPTAIRTTLEGLRRKVGQARVLAVLEPRSNTMKRGAMKDELPASLELADKVYVYSAGLGWDAPAVFGPLGAKARCIADLDALVQAIATDAQPGDHVLVMSNGGFGGVHGKLLKALAHR